ncbi:MAG: T9SS type A sorting domain-containing protein [Bacteroidota bacterium]
MKTNLILTVLFITTSVVAVAQNYTSTNDGAWTTASNWNNTSGWGASTPPTDGSQGSGTITMNNNMTISGAYTLGSPTLNINANKTLTVNGAMTLGGGSDVNVSGNLTIYGDLTLNGTISILPGGAVTVYGNVIVNNANYLIVGTNATPPPYADLIIKNDLQQKNSGDVTLNKNARVAVFGNVTDSGGGGTNLTLNQGAEMYVNGNINYTGGGDQVANNNSVNPYGLYVNGSTSNSGGGSSTTSNKANKATMTTTNVPFTSWVNSVQSVMPVTFTSFGMKDNELMWTTASEENLDYFLLERSSDGREFFEVIKTNDHNYTIQNQITGRSYYKLSSVDLDGIKNTYKIISAVYESSKEVKMFPNPVVDSKLNIDFNFDPTEDVTVVITDLSGMEVSRQAINAMQNVLTLSIEPGTYLIKIQSSEIALVSRVVVR